MDHVILFNSLGDVKGVTFLLTCGTFVSFTIFKSKGWCSHLQCSRDERGDEDEQLFYVPKCIYIDYFATRERK